MPVDAATGLTQAGRRSSRATSQACSSSPPTRPRRSWSRWSARARGTSSPRRSPRTTVISSAGRSGHAPVRHAPRQRLPGGSRRWASSTACRTTWTGSAASCVPGSPSSSRSSLLLAANAVLGGSARIVYSLARHHQVPAALGRVHATRMTPYVGILLFGLVAAVLLIPDDPLLLLGLFGFGATLAFTLANASVVALRYREPAISRPFVIPFNVRVRGVPLPIPAIVGARRPWRSSGCSWWPPTGRARSSASRGSPRDSCCTPSTAAAPATPCSRQPREAEAARRGAVGRRLRPDPRPRAGHAGSATR